MSDEALCCVLSTVPVLRVGRVLRIGGGGGGTGGQPTLACSETGDLTVVLVLSCSAFLHRMGGVCDHF